MYSIFVSPPPMGSTKYCKFVVSMSVCLSVCVFDCPRSCFQKYMSIFSNVFVCYVWLWRSYTACVPVFGVIFAHVNWLLDVAVRWRQRALTYAALVWRVGIGLGPPFRGIEITSSRGRKHCCEDNVRRRKKKQERKSGC